MKGYHMDSTSIQSRSGETLFFENCIWLSTEEAAVYLRKFTKDGKPSVGAIRNMVYRGQIRFRKFCSRLYFKRAELDYMLETSLQKEAKQCQ